MSGLAIVVCPSLTIGVTVQSPARRVGLPGAPIELSFYLVPRMLPTWSSRI